jgi:glucosamine-6-phosphate deaminase
MQINIHDDKGSSGKAAAELGAQLLRQALECGDVSIIVATGNSQFDMMAALVEQPDIDWSRITGFHLDEYLGVEDQHPASFRKYLKERFVDKVPLKQFHYVNGESDAEAECDRLGKLISDSKVDVAFIGIGENGHLAFNDPPADFETETPFLVVDLDQACREQQFGEGWFPDIDSVPKQAISMSVKQILKSKHIVCTVPDERKSVAVQKAVEGDVSPTLPASILQSHPSVNLFLDQAAASRLAKH